MNYLMLADHVKRAEFLAGSAYSPDDYDIGNALDNIFGFDGAKWRSDERRDDREVFRREFFQYYEGVDDNCA